MLTTSVATTHGRHIGLLSDRSFSARNLIQLAIVGVEKSVEYVDDEFRVGVYHRR
jgi:hypothetical protein